MGKGREGNCRNFYGGLGKERDQDMLQVGDRNSLLLENQLLPPLTPPPNETEQKNFPPSWFKRALFPHHTGPPPPGRRPGNLSPPPTRVTSLPSRTCTRGPCTRVGASRGSRPRREGRQDSGLSSQRELCGVMEANRLGSVREWGSLLSAGLPDPACQSSDSTSQRPLGPALQGSQALSLAQDRPVADWLG